MLADLVPISASLLERLAGLRRRRRARASASERRALAVLRGQGARVTTAEFFAFWRAIEEIGGALPTWGCGLGGEAQPHQQHVASMAALHSPNLGEALRKLARYKRLVCPEQITIEVVRGEARLRFEWLLAGEGTPAAPHRRRLRGGAAPRAARHG